MNARRWCSRARQPADRHVLPYTVSGDDGSNLRPHCDRAARDGRGRVMAEYGSGGWGFEPLAARDQHRSSAALWRGGWLAAGGRAATTLAGTPNGTATTMPMPGPLLRSI